MRDNPHAGEIRRLIHGAGPGEGGCPTNLGSFLGTDGRAATA